MTKSRPLLLFILTGVVAAGLSSCKNQSQSGMSQNQGASAVLFPLEVGKRWSYVMTTYDSLGKAIAAHEIHTTVVGDTVVAGETWFVMRDDSAEVSTNAANREDGLYLLAENGQEIQLYKYPASVGDECLPYTVASVDTTIVCGVGSFNCYQYRYSIDGQDGSGQSWLVTVDDFVAPGVGLVKHEVGRVWKGRDGNRETPGGREAVELVKM